MTMKSNLKTINSWCLYDWANSVYSLTITTAVFPIYYAAVTTKEDGSGMLDFFGISLQNTVWYSYTLSLAFLITVLLNPLLAGVSDYSGKRKWFLYFFAGVGSLSCCGLFLFTGANVGFGLCFFAFATFGYAGSLVFYNAYLPEIASESEMNRVSAKGFAWGYIGSVILLIVNLLIIQFPAWFGIPQGTLAARISFLMVGIWWLVFGWWAILGLPKDQKKSFRFAQLAQGYKEIQKVSKALINEGNILLYLAGFFFLSMGFQTIMYLATIFGSKELKIPESGLIGVVLIIQLIAIGGAYLIARIGERIGNLMVMQILSIACLLFCFAAYFIDSALQFYFLALAVGLIMGGLQSIARSTFSLFISGFKDHASYFSFYELVEKLAIVIGTASYGLIEQLSGSMRNSALFLGLYFILSFGLLFVLNRRKPFKVQLRA
jgi:MFS transporter, UMF1 family